MIGTLHLTFELRTQSRTWSFHCSGKPKLGIVQNRCGFMEPDFSHLLISLKHNRLDRLGVLLTRDSYYFFRGADL